MIVLVCGGRDYEDVQHIFNRPDELHKKFKFTHLIHGAARGADTIAGDWAARNGVQPVICPALWGAHGKRAGFARNRAMLDLQPVRCIHFPGGSGTADMVLAAKAAGVRCIKG